LQLLRDNRQEQAAYALLVQALKSYADDVELRYELAISAEKLGRPDEMEQILRAVIASKPDYTRPITPWAIPWQNAICG